MFYFGIYILKHLGTMQRWHWKGEVLLYGSVTSAVRNFAPPVGLHLQTGDDEDWCPFGKDCQSPPPFRRASVLVRKYGQKGSRSIRRNGLLQHPRHLKRWVSI
jgi:hypothetical protein